MRTKADFTNYYRFVGSSPRPPSPRVRDDLPDGQISARCARPVSSPLCKNISLGRLLEAVLLIPTVPPRIEGRIAIVTNVGCGMQWTRQRRKTSATDPPSLKLRRDWYQDHRAAFAETGADGEVVWSWHPDAGAKLAESSAGDGGNQARSPGRARRKPLKPLRREGRARPANLW